MKLTDAEWQVMNALWEKHPATARELAKHLPREINWAYTTLKTMLARLVEKGAVAECKEGNTSVYQPRLAREKARKSALHTLLDTAFGGAVGPLLHFLLEDEKLSPRERAEIEKMLKLKK